MSDPGLEESQNAPKNRDISEIGGSKSGNKPSKPTNSDQTVLADDPDLREVVGVWAHLPAAIKAGILAMVRSAASARS